jgi:hypothetical protein
VKTAAKPNEDKGVNHHMDCFAAGQLLASKPQQQNNVRVTLFTDVQPHSKVGGLRLRLLPGCRC